MEAAWLRILPAQGLTVHLLVLVLHLRQSAGSAVAAFAAETWPAVHVALELWGFDSGGRCAGVGVPGLGERVSAPSWC